MKKVVLSLLITLLPSLVSAAPSVSLQIELPRLQVAEYHKPYVAVWIENSKRQATQVAVWYDVEMREGKGKEWLADLRQWWRRGGRKLDLPVDGLTGATKGPGVHSVDVALQNAIAELPAGDYTLRVEAAREVGGRELLSMPISLPLNAQALPAKVSGKTEITSIQLMVE